MDTHLVLVNPVLIRGRDGYIVDGPTFFGRWAESTLNEAGVDSFAFPMNRPFESATRASALQDIALRTLGALRPERLNVIGLTNWATNAALSRVLAEVFKHPEVGASLRVMTVGGGPFFARETLHRRGEPFPDSIDAALGLTIGESTPVYDGIVNGGLQALLDLIGLLERDEYDVDDGRIVPRELPRGYYCRQGGVVRGESFSKEARMTAAPTYPILRADGSSDALIMFSNNCPNGCDYCSTGRNRRFSPEQIAASIGAMAERITARSGAPLREGLGMIKLLDPNPFCDHLITHTRRCLDAMDEALGFRPQLHGSYDSVCFNQPERVQAEIDEFNLTRIFVGRESVAEPGLSFIGRRHLRRQRSVQDVQDERAGLEEVIARAKEGRRSLGVTISYIVSPVDSVAALRALAEDMAHLRDLSEDHVRVTTQWGMLWPNSATRVIREYTDLLSDDPYFAENMFQVWSTDAVERRYPNSALRPFLSAASARLHEGTLENLSEVVAHLS